jgi:hypothetical protein
MTARQTVRMVVLTAAVSSGAFGVAPLKGSAASSTYSGPHSEWVGRLLDRAPDWRCPSSPSASDAQPPQVKATSCTRDTYVAAAVLQAWAAECYARFEQDARAARAAKDMIGELDNAQNLCDSSGRPTIGGGGSCDTDRIYRCGER